VFVKFLGLLGPQGALPLGAKRTTAMTDTSHDAFTSVGALANSMVGVIEQNSKDVKRRGVLFAVTVRNEVWRWLMTHPDGATADEIAAALKHSPFTIRPRVTELQKMGQIRDSGQRRANVSGRNAIVWVYVNTEGRQ